MKKFFWTVAILLMANNAYAQVDSQDLNECVNKSTDISDDALAVCFNDEAKRLLQIIKVMYEEAAQNPVLAKWSGGQGMQRGNLRTMFEAWLNYRNRYCSYYAVGKSNYLGSSAYNNADCMYRLTSQHLADVKSVLIDASSIIADPDPMRQ